MNRPLGFDGGLSVLAEPDYLVQHSLGDFPLRGFWDFHDFIPGNDGNGIAIGVESYALARDIIDDDGVEILSDELPARVLQNIFSFGGKAHKDLSSLLAELSRKMSGVASSSKVIGASRLILWPAADLGRSS